jgi:hypothetical protein
MSESMRKVSPGSSIDDLCRSCKMVRSHRVIVASPEGQAVRVLCEYCNSQHNFRGGGGNVRTSGGSGGSSGSDVATEMPFVSPRETSGASMSVNASEVDLELLLRRVIREESGLTSVTPADKWIGGDVVLRPGRDGLQEKVIPIETFFHKVVMVRNKLRVLEQQVNSSDLTDQAKAKIHGYITACYGSLTSFNVLFADEDDRFKGSAGNS